MQWIGGGHNVNCNEKYCALCSVHCSLCSVHSVQCAQCTVDWWWWARWALTRSPPCQKCHTPSYPFPNTPLLPVHSVHSAQCTVCRVAATVLTAGKMEWPQRELDCHLLLLLLLLLSAAYLLPLPTIYYLLDKSSSEEGDGQCALYDACT